MKRAMAFLVAVGLIAALCGLGACTQLSPKKGGEAVVKLGEDVLPLKPAAEAGQATKSLVSSLAGGATKTSRVVLRGVVKGGVLVVESATEAGHGAVTEGAQQAGKATGRVVDTIKGVADGTQVVITGVVKQGAVIAESVIKIGEKEEKKQ